MRAFEVNTPILADYFFSIQNKIYNGNRNWSIQLGSDLDQIFNVNKNSLFKSGNLKRWIVLDNWNNVAGRISAFYSVQNDKIIKGGFGFFECSENDEVADCLLDVAINWLTSQGCTSIEGPVNFGDKDRYWGLLTNGFDLPCLYLENYNPHYYEGMFKRYGLKEKDVIDTYEVSLDQVPKHRLKNVSDRLTERYRIEFRNFSFDRLEEFARDIHRVYINSFQQSTRFNLLEPEDICGLIISSQTVISDDLIWLAYQNDTPIGLLACMKDLNQVIMNSNGDRNLKGFAMSVIPQFRKMGVELGLAHSLYEALISKATPYTLYFTGVNSNTSLMTSFMSKLNAVICKTHKTFTI
jgi:hypothetical protein